MDRFESMTVLLTAVEAGSLSAAGRRLGMPLATVSRKVSELETHVKARLLSRSTRKLTLTDAGRDYVVACKRILEDVNEAERAASGEYSAPRGELIVTAPIVFGRLHVLPVTTEFLAAYPEVAVRLVLGDRVVNLLEDQVDLAVRIGELPDSSLIATRVGTIRRVVCGSPDVLRGARHAGIPSRARRTSVRYVRGLDVAGFLGLQSRRCRRVGAGAFATHRQHGGGGHRCRNLRRRRDTRVVLPDRSGFARGVAGHSAAQFRARASAGQSRLRGSRTPASETARVSRLCGSPLARAAECGGVKLAGRVGLFMFSIGALIRYPGIRPARVEDHVLLVGCSRWR